MNVVAKQSLRLARMVIVLAAGMLTVASGHAATLAVHVIADGRPLADAVVTAVAQDPAVARTSRPQAKAIMVQQFQQFDPFVLPVQVGTTVDFPNRDPFRHHVYSFSPAKSFELKLYGGERTEIVTFDKEGVVALGCNIHDNMLAYIYVVSTPFFVKTDARGQGTIANLPAGSYTITVWHPNQKGDKPQQDITLTADGKSELDLVTAMKREYRQRLPGQVDENAY